MSGSNFNCAMRKYLKLESRGETYLFFYDQESVPELLETLRSFNDNPDLSFGGYDYERCRRKVLGYYSIPFNSLVAKPAK